MEWEEIADLTFTKNINRFIILQNVSVIVQSIYKNVHVHKIDSYLADTSISYIQNTHLQYIFILV